jgi:beta-1,4-mannosyl-glycoprotein beta-1,4-N-acetylglucosaminyltransferase
MFYNEFDLLELRLRELYDYVDIFVIVESDLSHTNNPKPYRFEQSKERYNAWADKIRYIKHVSQSDPNPWTNETAQRSAISEGIQDANDNDIIIVSDLDEIIRSSVIKELRLECKQTIYGFHMPLFNFKFNYMRVDPGAYDVWAMAAKASWIKRFSPQMLRNQRENLYTHGHKVQYQKHRYTNPDSYTLTAEDTKIIQHGGWHFGYLGDNEWLLEKAYNNCHQEDITKNFLAQLDVEKSIKEKKCWNKFI